MEEKKYELKKELIEKAKALVENPESANVLRELQYLEKSWRKTRSDEDSFYEKELEDEFNSYISVLSSKQGELRLSAEEKKNEIIAAAKEVLEEKSFKKATAKMNDLMDEWKASGRISKEKDDELWAQFKEVRDAFFEKRKAYYAELTERFAASKQAKEELIQKAKEANEMTDIKELTNVMNDLMDQWKKAGNAGKESDDALWQQFLAERQAFNKKRQEYYAGLKETYAKRVESKKNLIAQAKLFLAKSEFTKEEVDGIKDLRKQWKEVGNAGKDNEETLWEEFNTVVNRYFDNKKSYDSSEY